MYGEPTSSRPNESTIRMMHSPCAEASTASSAIAAADGKPSAGWVTGEPAGCEPDVGAAEVAVP